MRLPSFRDLLILALVSLSSAVSGQDLSAGLDCSEIPGTAPLLAPGRIVMVGEVHGTREMPAELLRLVCGALRRGQAVSVGLEMADPNGAVRAYMGSGGDAVARQALLAERHWNGMRDGRSSLAWLDMIETFRSMRQRGMPVGVFALNDRPFTGDRDQAMAARVREEHAAHPASLIFTYTGNVHSMLARAAWLPAQVPAPMGAQVADLDPVSIELTSEAGESWLCKGPQQCGVERMSPTPENGPPHVARPSPKAGVYTLRLNVGPIRASLPAVPVPASSQAG
jgi:hypothetical protein